MTDAYVTLVTSDNYVSGAVTLAHSLRLSGTNKKIVCMVTPEVSPGSKDYLLDPGHLYDELIPVEPFNSFDSENLNLLGRPELGITLTKINIWNLLQFRYVVFIDADAMVLRNIDELFERLERADTMVNSEVFAAAPDTGWPDNFNSGLFACKPSVETYTNLKALALSAGSFDGADQGLLNRYFKNWSNTSYGRLSFTFNVTPSAYYSYAPAYAEYMSNIKVVHFIGPEKPWNWDLRFADGKIMPRGFTSHQFKELALQWWNIRDDFDTFKRNGYKKVEYIPPTPPPEPEYHEEYHEEYHPPPQEYHPPPQEYHPPPQEYHHEEYHQEYHEEYHEPPHEEYHEAPREAYYEPPPEPPRQEPEYIPPPPPEPEPQPQPQWEVWSTWHPTDNAWQAPQPASDYCSHQVEDFSQSQYYPNFEVVTPPQQEVPKEEPFTFVDCPKPPHIHDIMEAYDNKQENVPEEEEEEEVEVVEEHYYSFNQAPANDLSHYKVGWNFGELSGFKPHIEKMTEEEKESNRLFMNLPGIRVNALYETTNEFRDPDDIFSTPRDAPYKYDPSIQGTFAEYGNITEKPTYDVASDYGSENQSFVHEPSSYMSETHESEADLDNYDLYGFSYLPNLKKKKSDSSMSITSETPSGHRRMSRRRSIASSISMDFEDFQFNKNTFGINDNDPYNYNGVIDDNFHDDLFEDVDVYDGMYMNQQEPYTDENASYNEEDLQTDGYFPEEFDELNKNKVTDTINITEVTNELTLPENKNTVVVSDTYITKHKEPEEPIAAAPKEAAVPEPEEPIAAAPKEAAVPEPEEPIEAAPKEAAVPEPEEPIASAPKEAAVPEPEEPIEAAPKEAAVPESKKKSKKSKSKTTTTTKTITSKKSPQEEVEVIEEIIEIPVEEKVQSKSRDVPIAAAPKEAAVPESKKKSKKSKSKTSKTTTTTTTKTSTTKKVPQDEEEVEIIEEIIEIPVEEKVKSKSREASTGGSKKVIRKGPSGDEEEEVEIIEEVIEIPYDGKTRSKSAHGPDDDDEVEVVEEVIEVPYDQPDQQKLVSKKVTKQVLRVNPKTGKKEVVEEVVDTSGKSGSYEGAEEVEVMEEVVEVPYDQPHQQKLISKKVTKQVSKINPVTGKKELVEVVEEPSVKSREASVTETKKTKEASKTQQKKSSKKTTTTTKTRTTKKDSGEEEVEVIEEIIELPEEKIQSKSREVSTGGSKKIIKKGSNGEEEEEVEIIEEVIEIPYDAKSGSKGADSPDDEVEVVEEVIEVPYDQPDQQKLVSKKVTKQVLRVNPKTGKKEIVEEVVDTSGKTGSYESADEVEVMEEVVEVPYDQPHQQKLISKKVTKQVSKINPVTGKKELVEVVEEPSVKSREVSVTETKKTEEKKQPSKKISYSSSKKVVSGGDSNSKEDSTSKVTVVKKVVRKSSSGKVLEVKQDNVPPSDTKVTRTIVIKNKDGEVVDTKTMEGSIDDVETRTSDLIGTGVVNVSDDSNHLSTKIRRTVIRKNANGEILSTESKNIENEESLDDMKSISLFSSNKSKSTSNGIDQ